MKKSELGIGVVGTGVIAGFHAQALKNVERARLVAATDTRVEAGKKYASEYSCDFAPSLEDLLARKDVDAVAITTPSGSHAEIGMAAARAGKHVLCEKPLDVTLEKVDALIRTCREQGVHLGAVLQTRMGDSGKLLKQAVEEGRFGKLSQCSAYIPWFRSKEYYASSGWRATWEHDGGGALMNQSIHAIDMLLWVAGDVEEVSACCQTRLHQIEVEDNAVAWLKFKNGAIGVVQGSTCSYPGLPKRVEIMGTSGSVVMADDDFKVWSFAEARPEDADRLKPQGLSGIGGGASDPKTIGTEGHRRIYVDFIDAVLADRPSSITGDEARRAVELILAIYQSSREGRPVRLRPAAGK
jgi:UDP-N-acetyl-2-amino-2-deoxyglucuronate dehydrogenase